MKTLFLALTVCLCVNSSFGQQPEYPDLQYITDELTPQPEGDADHEDVYENLVQILSSPHDLNSVRKEELEILHILTDAQIANFLAYREQHGMFADVHELQVVPGFDPEAIRHLMPFVKVTDPTSKVNRSLVKRMLSNDNMYLLTRYERTLQKKKGYSSSGGSNKLYPGSPDKLYYRFRSSQPGDFSLGITGEKDAGEQLIFNPRDQRWGFDFTSWHIQVRNKGRITNMIAGDFQTQFGQGLMFGGAFGLGKGAETTSTARRGNVGFLPYTSLNEGAYMRGVAITLDLAHHTSLSLFYSRARRDATTDSLSDATVIRSILATGYHRTTSELAKMKTITEQNCGLVAVYRHANVETGMHVNVIGFDTRVQREETLYNQFAFTGSQNINYGLFINYTISNVSFFSEAVQTLGAGRALVAGALISLHNKLELAILRRDYMRDYHSFYVNAFSENTQPQNERGTYWGWKYRWSRQLALTGYVDLFTFPWLGFRRYRPSSGNEWLLRSTYKPSKTVLMFIQFRQEVKERNLSLSDPLHQVAAGRKRNFVLHCEHGLAERLRLKARVQYNTYKLGGLATAGLAVMFDASFDIGRFAFAGRHALFDTDHFDNRQYVYESDAWLSYSLPAYSGAGVRNYALIEFKIHNNLTLWIRYASTRLINVAEIGSGPESIAGNTRNDVKFQARLKF